MVAVVTTSLLRKNPGRRADRTAEIEEHTWLSSRTKNNRCVWYREIREGDRESDRERVRERLTDRQRD